MNEEFLINLAEAMLNEGIDEESVISVLSNLVEEQEQILPVSESCYNDIVNLTEAIINEYYALNEASKLRAIMNRVGEKVGLVKPGLKGLGVRRHNDGKIDLGDGNGMNKIGKVLDRKINALKGGGVDNLAVDVVRTATKNGYNSLANSTLKDIKTGLKRNENTRKGAVRLSNWAVRQGSRKDDPGAVQDYNRESIGLQGDTIKRAAKMQKAQDEIGKKKIIGF